jgi:hypothetical protein
MRQRGAIRIFRAQWHPQGCPRFQPEWEPVGDPYDNAAAGRSKLPRIPRRYTSHVMSVTVSVAMSAVITLFVAVRNYGVSLETLLLWATAWPVSCLIAVPTRFAITPLVKRITSALVEPPAKPE